MREQYTSYEELPVMLTVKQVAAVLSISEAKAYELSKEKGFPAFRVGCRICISKQQFIAWIQQQIS